MANRGEQWRQVRDRNSGKQQTKKKKKKPQEHKRNVDRGNIDRPEAKRSEPKRSEPTQRSGGGTARHRSGGTSGATERQREQNRQEKQNRSKLHSGTRSGAIGQTTTGTQKSRSGAIGSTGDTRRSGAIRTREMAGKALAESAKERAETRKKLASGKKINALGTWSKTSTIKNTSDNYKTVGVNDISAPSQFNELLTKQKAKVDYDQRVKDTKEAREKGFDIPEGKQAVKIPAKKAPEQDQWYLVDDDGSREKAAKKAVDEQRKAGNRANREAQAKYNKAHPDLKAEDMTYEEYQKMWNAIRMGNQEMSNKAVGKELARKIGSMTAYGANKNSISRASHQFMQAMSYNDVENGIGTYGKAEKQALQESKESTAGMVGYGLGFMANMALGKTGAMGKSIAGEGAESAAKQFFKNRAGELVAETPMNVADAVKMAKDENGKINKKQLALFLGINTGLTGAMGSAMEGIGIGITRSQVKEIARLTELESKGMLDSAGKEQLQKLQTKVIRATEDATSARSKIANNALGIKTLEASERKELEKLAVKRSAGGLTEEETKRFDTLTKDAQKISAENAAIRADLKHSLSLKAETLNKLSKETGAEYKVANTEEIAKALKESTGQDVDPNDFINGVTITGKDGKKTVYVNSDSDQALGTIVGHETTHLLAGTKQFDALRDSVKEFSESIEEYTPLREEFERIYANDIKNMSEEEAEKFIDEEVTSELVGRYLFGENAEEFVRQLSIKDRNVFQQIYDYIVRAIKNATGDAELRQLNAIKENFDKAYRELGETPESMAKDADARKSMGGKNAAGKDRDAGEFAENLYRLGLNDDDIHRITGWHVDTDGKAKFEFSDKDMKLTVKVKDLRGGTKKEIADAKAAMDEAYNDVFSTREEYGPNSDEMNSAWDKYMALSDEYDKLRGQGFKLVKLGDVLKHDELFKYYPELKDTPVSFVNKRELGGANARVTINGKDALIQLNREAKKANLEVDLLHEIQHVIQNREGFAGGANKLLWKRIGDNLRREMSSIENELPKEVTQRPTAKKKVDLIREHLGDAKADEYEKYQTAYNKMYKDDSWETFYGESGRDYAPYHHTKGEWEARTTEGRRKMSQKELDEKARPTDPNELKIEDYEEYVYPKSRVAKAKDVKYSKGYHAGDLGKAEPRSNMSGDRGTGHFGTGTYFVGDKAQIERGGYKGRPIEEVDFDKYNMWKPLLKSDAMNMHDFLKSVNTYWDKVDSRFQTIDDIFDAKREGAKIYDEFVDAARKDRGDNIWEEPSQKTLNEYGEKYRKFFEDTGTLHIYDEIVNDYRTGKMFDGNYDSYTIDELARQIDDRDSEWYRAVDDIRKNIGDDYSLLNRAESLFRGTSSKDLKKALREVAEDMRNDKSPENVQDSASTRLMKKLGYEGIDVRGTDLDNTTYGSVIYDLKGEDLARKQEIGTARFSKSKLTKRDIAERRRKAKERRATESAPTPVAKEPQRTSSKSDEAQLADLQKRLRNVSRYGKKDGKAERIAEIKKQIEETEGRIRAPYEDDIKRFEPDISAEELKAMSIEDMDNYAKSIRNARNNRAADSIERIKESNEEYARDQASLRGYDPEEESSFRDARSGDVPDTSVPPEGTSPNKSYARTARKNVRELLNEEHNEKFTKEETENINAAVDEISNMLAHGNRADAEAEARSLAEDYVSDFEYMGYYIDKWEFDEAKGLIQGVTFHIPSEMRDRRYPHQTKYFYERLGGKGKMRARQDLFSNSRKTPTARPIDDFWDEAAEKVPGVFPPSVTDPEERFTIIRELSESKYDDYRVAERRSPEEKAEAIERMVENILHEANENTAKFKGIKPKKPKANDGLANRVERLKAHRERAAESGATKEYLDDLDREIEELSAGLPKKKGKPPQKQTTAPKAETPKAKQPKPTTQETAPKAAEPKQETAPKAAEPKQETAPKAAEPKQETAPKAEKPQEPTNEPVVLKEKHSDDLEGMVQDANRLGVDIKGRATEFDALGKEKRGLQAHINNVKKSDKYATEAERQAKIAELAGQIREINSKQTQIARSIYQDVSNARVEEGKKNGWTPESLSARSNSVREYDTKSKAEQVKERRPSLEDAKGKKKRLSGPETKQYLENMFKEEEMPEQAKLHEQVEMDLRSGAYRKGLTESPADVIKKAQKAVDDDMDSVYARQVKKLDSDKVTAEDYAERRLLLNKITQMIRNGEGDVDKLLKMRRDLAITDIVCVADSKSGIHAARLMGELTPEGRCELMLKKVESINEKFGERMKEPVELTEEQYNRILNAKDEREAVAIMDDVSNEVMRQVPSTLFEKLNEIRRFTMLFNLRTHGRNFLGNIVFRGVRSLSDALEVRLYRIKPIRNKLEKLGGTVEMNHWSYHGWIADNKKALKNTFKEVYKASGSESKYRDITRAGQAMPFKSKVVNAILNFNYWLLEKEDMFTFKPAFNKEFARWCDARGIKSIADMTAEQIDEAAAHAIGKAEYATFRDNSAFSQKVCGLKAKTASKTGKGRAGYRFINAVLEGHFPFVKTPVNIARRTMDYSPVGLANGIRKAITAETADEFKYGINRLSSGLTGTGIVLLGMHLHHQGHIVTEAKNVNFGTNEDGSPKRGDAYYNRDMGYQDYSLIWHNPFNDKDYSASIDWLSPTQVPLFMGAAIAEKLEEDGVGPQDAMDIAIKTFKPMLEMSFMQTSSETVRAFTERVYRNGTGDDADWAGAITQTLFGRIPQGYLGSLVPQFSSQLANATDKYQRDTRSTKESAVAASYETWGRQIANKFPVLRWKINHEKRNRMGKKAMNTGGENVVVRALVAMASPSNLKRITLNDDDRELIDIYNKIPETDKNKKYFWYPFTGNPDYELPGGDRMTYKDLDTYGKVKRQTQMESIKDMFKSDSYKNMPNSMKVDEIDEYNWIAQTKADSDTFGPEYAVEKIVGSNALTAGVISGPGANKGTTTREGYKVEDGNIVTDDDRAGGKTDAEAWRIYRDRNGDNKKTAQSFVDFWIEKEKLVARSHNYDYHVKGMACALTGNKELARAYDVNMDKVTMADEYVKDRGKTKARKDFSNACCDIASGLKEAGVESTSKANRSWAAAGCKIDQPTYRVMGFDWDTAQSGAGLRNVFKYTANQLITMANDAKYEYDKDESGTLNKDETIEFIDNMDIKGESEDEIRQQKACIFAYMKPGTNNPYDSIDDYLGWGENTDEKGKGGRGRRRGGRRRGGRGGWGGGGGGGSATASATAPETASGAIKGKVTKFGMGGTASDITFKSNLNDAYRRRARKLREQTRKKA